MQLPTSEPRMQVAASQAHQALIPAGSDAEYVEFWLKSRATVDTTYQLYRRESARFLFWMRTKELSLAAVKATDVADYMDFLRNPPAEWCSTNRTTTESADWRPFAGPLRDSSVKTAVAVLKALYSFLCDACVLSGNPFNLIKHPRESAPVERYLEVESWHGLFDFICQMDTAEGVSRAHAVRSRWIFAVLYLTGLRRSELASAKMGDFQVRSGKWWLRVVGKGSKVGFVPVPDAMLAELRSYRLEMGLSEYPLQGEETPLVVKISQRTGELDPRSSTMTPQAIHLVVKEVLAKYALKLESQGLAFEAQRMRQVSAHWLRHTSATHQLQQGVDLVQVSRNLRHGNLETTNRYLHTEDNERHDASRGFTTRFTD